LFAGIGRRDSTSLDIGRRCDPRERQEIVDSRVDSTGVLGKAIAACNRRPSAWLNSISATVYRDARDAIDWIIGDPALDGVIHLAAPGPLPKSRIHAHPSAHCFCALARQRIHIPLPNLGRRGGSAWRIRGIDPLVKI
jgi:NAD dependent epimerase/dehydratase family enzyme